jgi:predicted Zn-dependent peptidase
MSIHAAEATHARYKKSVLPNGIRVVTEQVSHVRSVAIGVWVRVGSRDERPGLNGISHFVEHMVFKGTRHYRTGEIARSLESVGGFLNAFTSKEHTCFYARVLDQHVDRALHVLSDLVQYPLFSPRELEKEKNVVLEELKNLEDNPEELIFDHFDRLVFGNHPLGFPVIGQSESIASFDRTKLFDHVHRHYDPRSMVIAAAGNVDHDSFSRTAQSYFRLRADGRRNGALEPAPHRSITRREEHEKPISQAHVCMGTIGVGSRSRHRFPFLVLNTLLGDGMSSRLFQNIRERYGFAYNVYSFANILSDTGTFGIYVGTDAANIENSIELIHAEFAKLRSRPVSKAELRRTKEQLKGTTMLSLESMSSRLMRLVSGELAFGEYITPNSILRDIDAVNRDDILAMAQSLLDESKYSAVVYRPAEKTKEETHYSTNHPAALDCGRRTSRTSKRK